VTNTRTRSFADQHEVEMADLLLEEFANDGVDRTWDECKKLVVCRLQDMGLTKDLADNAVWLAIKTRNG
jgi:hypothetical protein